MKDKTCPREIEALAACRRGPLDAAMSAHVDSCPDCRRTIALDRTLAFLSATDEPAPLPSPEALRLDSQLVAEQRHLARRAAVQLGLYALAFCVCVALLASAWALESGRDGPASVLGATGSISALVVVGISLWNLVRSAREAAALS